jgi:L-alanine-DL-glutamate epimerase-like enolase superfamily enzyme
MDEMIEAGRFGLEYTPCIKIKLDSDTAKGRRIVTRLSREGVGNVWSIDANSAWPIETAEAYLPVLTDVVVAAANDAPTLYMVEQPFAVEYSPGEHVDLDDRWIRFRSDLNRLGVRLYADESISTVDDVMRFHHVVDGVNIKLEKAGGIRAAMVATLCAREVGLAVWIGTMVSTCLGCSQSAQVSYLADDSDVDGGLLVFPDVFTGGFDWLRGGSILLKGYRATRSDRVEEYGDSSVWGFGVALVPCV